MNASIPALKSRTRQTASVVAVLGLSAGLAVAAEDKSNGAAEDGTLFWHTELDKAKEEAKATGKPIFLEFRCAP